MAKDKPDQPDKAPGKPVHGKIIVTGQAGSRLIQQSPDADPKLVEVAREFARELKEKQGDAEEDIDYIPEAPVILNIIGKMFVYTIRTIRCETMILGNGFQPFLYSSVLRVVWGKLVPAIDPFAVNSFAAQRHENFAA